MGVSDAGRKVGWRRWEPKIAGGRRMARPLPWSLRPVSRTVSGAGACLLWAIKFPAIRYSSHRKLMHKYWVGSNGSWGQKATKAFKARSKEEDKQQSHTKAPGRPSRCQTPGS